MALHQINQSTELWIIIVRLKLLELLICFHLWIKVLWLTVRPSLRFHKNCVQYRYINHAERQRNLHASIYMRPKTITLLLFSAFFSMHSLPTMSSATEKATPNYCRDEASWNHWHSLLTEHPSDETIIYLYALRRGLCSMVESGNLEIDKPTGQASLKRLGSQL